MHRHPRLELGRAGDRPDPIAVGQRAVGDRGQIVDRPLKLGARAVARLDARGQVEAEPAQQIDRSLVIVGRPNLERTVAPGTGAIRRLIDRPSQDGSLHGVVEPAVAAPSLGCELRPVLPAPADDAIVGSPQAQPL